MTLQDSFAAACCQVIRERRQSLGISQEEVAKRSGLARSYVCDVERGARHPSMRNLSILSSSLAISVSDLMTKAEVAMVAKMSIDDLLNKTPDENKGEIIDYINNLKHGIIVCDRDNLIFSNHVAKELAGINGTGQKCNDMFEAEGGDRIPDTDRPLSRALRGEVVEDVKVMLKHERFPEGRVVAVSARPLKQGEAILAGVVLLRPAT